jgi:hypothetical protein
MRSIIVVRVDSFMAWKCDRPDWLSAPSKVLCNTTRHYWTVLFENFNLSDI